MDRKWKKDFGLRFFNNINLTTLKIAIVGSRTFNDYTLLVNYIEKIAAENNYIIDEVISDGATLGFVNLLI